MICCSMLNLTNMRESCSPEGKDGAHGNKVLECGIRANPTPSFFSFTAALLCRHVLNHLRKRKSILQQKNLDN